jgi:hypothetical protein
MLRRLIVVAVILVGLLAGADRLAAYLASRAVADEIARQAPECAHPGVDIGGFPFLTQAIAGRYDDVTLTTSCAATSALTLDPVRVELHGAHAGIGEVLHRQLTRLPVDRLDAQATIPFVELDQQASGQSLRFSPGPGGTVTVTGTVSVGDQHVSAHGTGQVSIASGHLQISVADVVTPLGTVPGGAFDVSLPVAALPFHLTQAAVSASAEGIVIRASGRDIVLSQP